MRKIKIIEHISLDGVIQAPGGPEEDMDGNYPYGGWAAPHDDPDGGAAIVAAQGEKYDLLLGRRVYDIFAAYWPAKSDPMADSLNAATKYVATQHGRENIRCNSIAPGVVLTEALDKTAPGLKEIIKRHVLTPEFGTPDDIAALVAFLASDESRYITGENISISGGGLVHQPHYADLLDLMAK